MDNYHLTDSLINRQATAKKRKNKSGSKFSFYNYYFIVSTSIPLFIVGIFNWAIDPQDIFNTPNYWHVNHQKINKDNNDRLFKAADIIRLKPMTIVVGSSRTKQGIDPSSPSLKNYKNVYNLALNGPNFYEVKRYIEHAIYNQPNLDRIILGLDFFMFNQNLDNQVTFVDSRLEKKRFITSDLVQNLFSLDALTNSWETIKASQKNPETSSLDNLDNGFMPNLNFDNGEAIWRFHQSIKLYYSLHSNYQLSPSYWSDFEQIVKLCQQNDIELQIFISPAHATHWESIWTTNKWSVFEQWKRDVVKLTPVWDFSGYNSVTTESIGKHMKNYVDNSHYTPEIGDQILQRILGENQTNLPPDFGIFLTPENIEQHLAKINRDRKQWLKNNPEEVEIVRKFYAETQTNK